MKKYTIPYLFAIVAALFLYSCENEPVDPALLVVDPNTCAAPSYFEISDFINGNTVLVDWDKSSGSGSWEVQYGINGFVLGSGTTKILTPTTSIINGLVSSIDYDFYIRTKCGSGEYSNWVGPISAGSSIATCTSPSNFSVFRSANINTQAIATWSVNGDEDSWELQFGSEGFILGTGTIIASNSNSKIIPGLLPTQGYDFYLRSKCSATDSSNWVGPINLAAVPSVSSGNYWPSAINNQWIFSLDGVNELPLKITSTTVIDGKTYFTFQQIPGASSGIVSIRKFGGDYFYRIADYTLNEESISGSESVILKDYLAVNGTWTDTFIQTRTPVGLPPVELNVTIQSTIVEKDVSVVVFTGLPQQFTYNNVIAVKRIETITGDGIPSSTITKTYWFSKDVGPVKIKTENEGVTKIQELSAYILF